MALDTYANLKTAISDHLDRDDLTTYVDDFIDLAEARHKREVRMRSMKVSAAFVLSESTSSVTLPSDFHALSYIRVEIPNATAGRKYIPDIVELSLHELTGKTVLDERPPHYYAVEDALYWDAPADQDYDGDIFYYKAVTALSGSNTSNEILAEAADLYLYAALLASAPFLLNDERIQTWGTLYADALSSVNEDQRKARRGGPMVTQIAGVGNRWR